MSKERKVQKVGNSKSFIVGTYNSLALAIVGLNDWFIFNNQYTISDSLVTFLPSVGVGTITAGTGYATAVDMATLEADIETALAGSLMTSLAVIFDGTDYYAIYGYQKYQDITTQDYTVVVTVQTQES